MIKLKHKHYYQDKQGSIYRVKMSIDGDYYTSGRDSNVYRWDGFGKNIYGYNLVKEVIVTDAPAPVKRAVYLNVYETGCAMFSTKEIAERYSNSKRLARIRVEYEDGQFDD